MSKKSGDEVLQDLFQVLKTSDLIAMLSGKLCIDATRRQLNSDKEDTVMIFKAGLDGQVQDGVVTLNIYVPDKDLGYGVKSKDVSRTIAISEKANEEFSRGKHIGNYWFRLGNMIQTVREETSEQHFVSIDLKFRLRTF